MDRFADLESFISVVEQGSFSAAGEQLGIAKSVVSRRVSRLEKRLGSQLLRRTTRRLTLTEAGNEFYRRARSVLDELEEAEQQVGEHAGALCGTLRLTAPMSFGVRHLAPALASFLRENDQIQLELDLNDRQVDLVEEGFDMAVRAGELRDSSLRARRLGTIRSITCASPDYLKRFGTPHHPDELVGHRALQYAHVRARDSWKFLDANDRPVAAQPQIVLHANNGEALAELAVAGLGIITSPTFILNDYCQRGLLQPILTDWRRPQVGLHALFPPGRLMPRRVRHLADFLSDRYGEHPDWDACLNGAN
jgi:DNA-binding transcriptional LysR family regulator